MAVGTLETLALVFAALIVITRLPAVLWPAAFKKNITRFWQGKRLSLFGGLFLLIGLGVLYLDLQFLSLAQVVASMFALAALFGAGMFFHPEFARAMMGVLVKKSDSWLRWHAGAAVAIGLLIIYYVLYAY